MFTHSIDHNSFFKEPWHTSEKRKKYRLIGIYQKYIFFCFKGHHQRSEKATYIMVENICKSYNFHITENVNAYNSIIKDNSV